MLKKSRYLLIFFLLINFLGCTLSQKVRIKPPMDSYVKVFHHVEIVSCKEETKEDKKNNKCSVGTFAKMGSGLIVDISKKYPFGFILTAGHVCRSRIPDNVKVNLQFNQVMDNEGQLHDAHVVVSSQIENGPDLCLMWAPTIEKKGIKVSNEAPIVGEEVYYIGSPAGIYHPPTAPVLTGIYSGEIDDKTSMVTVPAMGGSSGSAILNNKNEIIGVLWATHPSFNYVSLMSTYSSFKKFIDLSKDMIGAL